MFKNLDLFQAGIILLCGLMLLWCAFMGWTTSLPEANDKAKQMAQENLTMISPRPGVECYILRGTSSYNPRSMSCVTIPSN